MTSYPVGYGTATVSFAELKRRYSGGMEPEFARRLFAWLASNDGAIGIGSASRPTPHPVSRASRLGRSFHQLQTFADGSRHFCAVDLVHINPGSVHRAPRWSESIEQGSSAARKWGLHCNVQRPSEPWHMQPIEIDGYQSWVNNGRPRAAPNYEVPGNPSKVTQPKPIAGDLGVFDPDRSEYGLFPAKVDKAEVDRQFRPRPSDLVRYLQGVMTNQCNLAGIDIDGIFGQITEGGVKSVQEWNGIDAHGRVDSVTWGAIDAYATI